MGKTVENEERVLGICRTEFSEPPFITPFARSPGVCSRKQAGAPRTTLRGWGFSYNGLSYNGLSYNNLAIFKQDSAITGLSYNKKGKSYNGKSYNGQESAITESAITEPAITDTAIT